ncbi:arylsulfatase [Alkaliflexus imshenetskii]|uniref:arylsulfatase n=1 Tax=Alkaliflexus imshenetskii TaxID=286730 RepID=UPI00047B8A41|nr:arylsulfatase [Alkaliflexus imshenetskii]
MYFINHLNISLAALGAITLGSCAQDGKRAEVNPPNIIFILADDLGYGDLSCYGQEKFSTPNIDRLSAEGIRFTNHYSGSTVSAPSRSSLLTGLHTGNTPVRGNKEYRPEGQQPLPQTTRTIAHVLKDAGYTNGIVGKWGLGYPGSGSEPLDMGFDYFFGNNCQRHAHHYFVDYLWENRQRVSYDEPVYSHDAVTDKGMQFIRDHKDKPFFLYMAYAIPHAEMVLPQEYLEPFIGKYPEPNPWPAGHSYGEQPYPRAALAAMITHLDSDVGRIMDLLAQLGIDDNTLVIFTSDNGPAVEGGNDPAFFNSSGGLRGTKRDLYEGGIRVPFVARFPGVIPKGVETGHISAFWDVFPTFSELAGVVTDVETDGISLVPVFMGQADKQPKHEYLYWEFHELGARQAVRMDQWKGVRYNLTDGNRDIELYNLDNDPGETTNIASDYADVVARISEIMRSARVASPEFPFPMD